MAEIEEKGLTDEEKAAFKERLKSRLDEMGINYSDLARQIGLERQYIYGWLKRGRIPPAQLFEIAAFLRCDPEWLQVGQNSNPKTVNVSTSQIVIPIFKQGDYKQMQEGERLKYESLLGRDEWLAEVFGVNPSNGDYEIYRMESNEMSPKIRRGDLVVIDKKAKQPVNGLYAIEGRSGGLSVATVQWEHDGDYVQVRYDNPSYSALRFKESALTLVGRVIYVWHGSRDFD